MTYDRKGGFIEGIGPRVRVFASLVCLWAVLVALPAAAQDVGSDAISRSISVVVAPAYRTDPSDAVARALSVAVQAEGTVAATDAVARALSVQIAPEGDTSNSDAIARALSVAVSGGSDNSQQDVVARALSVAVSKPADALPQDAIARAVGAWVTTAPNDLFTRATLLVGVTGSEPGSSFGAGQEDGEPSHRGEAPWGSVWYRWVAPISGAFLFDTCDGALDARVSVYTGTAVDALTPVPLLAVDGDCGPLRVAAFRAVGGAEYMIAVDGRNRQTGDFVISWDQIPPPSNDFFASPDTIAGTEGSVSGFNAIASSETDEPAHAGVGPTASLWWDWTAPESGAMDFRTCESPIDTTLAVYTGNALNNLTTIASNDDCCGLQSIVQFSATAGTRYVIVVDAGSPELGEVNLEWRPAEPESPDLFAEAELLPGSEGVVSGTLFGATTEPGEPNHGSSGSTRSVWYSWYAPRSGTVQLTVGDEAEIACYTGESLEELVLIDAFSDVVSFPAEPGVPYHFAIHGDTCASEPFEMIWSYVTPPLLTVGLGTLEVARVSPDGTRLASAGGGGAFVWSVETGEVQRRLEGHEATVNDVAFSADGSTLATAADDGTLRLYDIQSAREFRRFRHPQGVTAVAFAPDGTRVVTGCADGKTRIWKLNTGNDDYELSGHSAGVNSVAWSPDGTMFAAAGQNAGKVWRIVDGAQVHTLTGHTNTVNSIDFSSDSSTIVTGAADGTARLWSAVTGVRFRTIAVAGGDIRDARLSPDGSELAVAMETAAGADQVRVYNAITEEVLETFDGHQDTVNSVSWLPAGDAMISAGSDAALFPWRISGNGAFPIYAGHTQTIEAVGVSDDLNSVYTRNTLGLIRRWDLISGREIPLGFVDPPELSAVATAPGEEFYVTAGGEGTSPIFELRPSRAIIVAGGGPYAQNAIARQTHELSLYAYRTLLARNYTADDVLFLSAFPDGTQFPGGDPVKWDLENDGVPEIDGAATRQALQDALAGDFARDTGRLLILMLDHGYRTKNFMTFLVNPNEVVRTTELNTWLNTLQNEAAVDVTLLVDCCYSGRFLTDCAKTGAIPAERNRIVLTSTSDSAEAVFLPPPDLTSFLHIFLGSAYMGNSVGEAFRAGSRFFESFPIANQIPGIDDGTEDSSVVNRQFFGASWAYGVQPNRDVNDFFPVFAGDPADQTVAPGVDVNLAVEILPGQDPESIAAVIRPPAPAVISGDPVTDLPLIELSESQPRIWTGIIPAQLLEEEGVYTVSFNARLPLERISNPAFATVTVSSGPDPDATPIRAVLAVGQGANPAQTAAFDKLADTMYRIYLDRFQDEQGNPRTDWVDMFSAPDGYPANSIAGSVLSSISDFSNEAERLYLHLVARDGAGAVLDFSDSSDLTAAALDQALVNFENAGTGPEVIIVIDAPGSGSFLVPLEANNRIVMTSGRATDTAIYIADTRTSFTDKVLATAWQGNNLRTSYQAGDNFFSEFLNYFLNSIRPQLSDPGNLSAERFLGRRYAFAGDDASGLPFILSSTTTRRTTFWDVRAELVEGVTPSRVFAQIVEPGGNIDDPPEYSLTRNGGDSEIWTGTIPLNQLTESAAVLIYAAYPDGDGEKLSEYNISVIQESGGEIWVLR